MQKLVGNIEFGKAHNGFQDKLRKDINRIRSSSDAVFVKADKTRNLYQLPKTNYEKLLRENITKYYKKASGTTTDEINEEARNIATNLDIADRLDVIAEKDAYLTLKDHKENFPNKIPCRLINPAKTEMGLVSKNILDNLNRRVKACLGVTMWKNSAEVIDWFRRVERKDECSFLCFDIVEFYPSISEELLRKAIDFTKQHVNIPSNEIEVIFHARKSLLFSKNEAWSKKDGNGLFDVTMGGFDGAEVCELVGMYALAHLPERFAASSTGLYRDDGLGVLRGKAGGEQERSKKILVKYFKSIGLRITVGAGLTSVNFLDLTLDLARNKYYPFRKPNDRPLYINKSSNHPPQLLKQLPAAISRRLTDISSDQAAFEEAAPLYNEALQASGYTEKVKFMEERKNRRPAKKKSRARKITWFNPPFSRNVTTCIGRRFLQLINKHFPKGSKLYKIFNRSTVKISYSCMPNVGAIIKQHNSRVCRTDNDTRDRDTGGCNCRKRNECPLNNQCLTTGIVYRATVTTAADDAWMCYIGSTATTFKQRYANHKASFKSEAKSSQTELSKYVWELKRSNISHEIHWEILQRARPYNNFAKCCSLCLTEKLLIATADQATLLNKRSELASRCRHRDRFKLRNFKRTT